MDLLKSLAPQHKTPDIKVWVFSGKGFDQFYLLVPRSQHMAWHRAGTQHMVDVCMYARMHVWRVDRNVNYSLVCLQIIGKTHLENISSDTQMITKPHQRTRWIRLLWLITFVGHNGICEKYSYWQHVPCCSVVSEMFLRKTDTIHLTQPGWKWETKPKTINQEIHFLVE